MNGRNGRDSLFGARNFSAGSLHLHQHRRGQSFNGISKDSDENLDLFSRNRRTLSVASSDESSDVSVKLGRLSVGSAKLGRNGIDDLLSSTDGGKNDYDWLLTPPGTPVFPSSEGESQPTLAPPRSSSVRSTSTTKASRLSVSQSENGHPRAARSSSVTRSSISNSQYSTYSSNRSSSILNTSSASVSSYTRPSSPIARSPSTARPSTPSSSSSSSRPASRSSTPSRARSLSATPPTDKTRPSQSSSRPSTPSSRPHIPANLHSPSAPPARSLSRSSTPTRRSSAPSPSPSTASLNGRSSAPASRPSSPSPRPRLAPQPIVPPDFPLETPPNLRTTLPPDRPVSAGRSRPASSSKGNTETQPSNGIPRRQPSPIATRGRLTEPLGRGRVHATANGHHADVAEPRKVSPDVGARKSVKASTTASDSSGFGRSISKRSLDMAIRHMDIRNGSGNLRALSSTTLFPQSIRTSAPKSLSSRRLSAPASVEMNGGSHISNNGANGDSGNDMKRNMFHGSEAEERQHFAKLSEMDFYESSRYDAILLKEDLKNTNWLHSADDKLDQGPIFDNGFESLPEPFGLS